MAGKPLNQSQVSLPKPGPGELIGDFEFLAIGCAGGDANR
jgi:hypothetical protein